jgi:hypothetical protein
MADESPEITLGRSLPETVLPPAPSDWEEALGRAGRDERAVRAVVRAHPRYLAAWARLGEVVADDLEAYACFRVGYHRGLDALRQAGWKGSGYVRYSAPSNRGFLRSLAGLARAAAAIGEADEAERCAQFLRQLDPSLQEGRPLGEREPG